MRPLAGKGLALVCAALVVGGCSDLSYESLGATPGGAQDIGYARRLIDEGVVPQPELLTVEGLLSEHDLPLQGPACTDRLCVRAGVGIEHSFETGKREAFVQVGLSSNVDPSTFRRQPLNLGLAVDISGSMAGERMEAVRAALHKLVDQLDAQDRVTLVAFDNEADLRLGPVSGDKKKELNRAIDKLEADGGTCIECGLKLAFEKVDKTRSGDRENRVMLFTDAQPNVGATGEGEFTTLVSSYADRIGLTAFGVGIDFGAQLVNTISRVKGGNYFYLEDGEKIRTVFDEEFDLLVTPLAYDLELELSPGAGFEVAAVHGAWDWTPGEGKAFIRVPTVFLSKRRGALLVRLTGEATPKAPIFNAFLGWSEGDAAPRDASLGVSYDGEAPLEVDATWYSESGMRKTTVLVNFVLGARKACEAWHAGQQDEARDIALKLTTYLEAQAQALDDDGVRTEATLAAKLAALMQ